MNQQTVSKSLCLPEQSGVDSTAVLRLPGNSCDCHFHVFDSARYPYATARSFTPADATLASYMALCDRFGIDRAVLVHPTVFGADHRSFEEVLQTHPGRLRGVAVVHPETPEADIARWHRLGARGTRINALFASGPGVRSIEEIVAKIKPFGWHVELLIDVAEQPELAGKIRALGVEVVVGHMGHHPAAELGRSAGFANLLGLLADGAAWVKLSAPYRLSATCLGDADIKRLTQALVGANPDRVLWGTDWPHPNTLNAVPDPAQMVAQLFEWLPDAALRETVLVRNPTGLYWRDTDSV